MKFKELMIEAVRPSNQQVKNVDPIDMQVINIKKKITNLQQQIVDYRNQIERLKATKQQKKVK